MREWKQGCQSSPVLREATGGSRSCSIGGSTKLRGLPQWCSDKESVCECRRVGFDPWVGKIPWRRKWQPIPICLPGKSHGQRNLMGYSPWGHKELNTTELLSTHTHIHTHTHTHTHTPSSSPSCILQLDQGWGTALKPSTDNWLSRG